MIRAMPKRIFFLWMSSPRADEQGQDKHHITAIKKGRRSQRKGERRRERRMWIEIFSEGNKKDKHSEQLKCNICNKVLQTQKALENGALENHYAKKHIVNTRT